MKLLKILVFVTSLVTISKSVMSTNDNQQVQGTASFRRIGTFASKLSYGHIHSKFDFKRLKREHGQLTTFINDEIRKSDKNQTLDKTNSYFHILRHQIQTSTNEIDRVGDLFFSGNSHHISKRQIAGPVGLGFGLLGFGTSIYNLFEIRKLYSKITSMESRDDYISHELSTNRDSIGKLDMSIQTLKLAVTKVALTSEMSHMKMKHLMIDSILVSQHNQQTLEWGRGAEALLYGSLHPAMVDNDKLLDSLENLKKKAETKGLKLLHKEKSALFKAPISFYTTEDEELIIIIHVPMVEMSPIGLFEYIPIPIKIGNLMWFIDTPNRILAMDQQGNQGIEMTMLELFQCQIEKIHSGNLYLCPNSNLLRNNIRTTCLGSLMVGNSELTRSRCEHSIEKFDMKKEFAVQVSANTIVLNIREEDTVHEVCFNGTRTNRKKTGLNKLVVNPNCQIISDSFIFTPRVEIDIESEFIQQPITFQRSELLDQLDDDQLDEAFTALKKVKPLERKSVGEIKSWINENNEDGIQLAKIYGPSVISIFVCICVVIGISILYCKYKKSKTIPPTLT